MKCVLKDMGTKSDFFVNVTTRIWNGTFASVSAYCTTPSSAHHHVPALSSSSSSLSSLSLYCLFVSEQATFQSILLTVNTEIDTSIPELLVISYKRMPVLE